MYWLIVRLFHVVFGALLTYIAVNYFVNASPAPRWFYYLIAVLGVGAVLYHSYRLYQLIAN